MNMCHEVYKQQANSSDENSYEKCVEASNQLSDEKCPTMDQLI